MTENIRGSSRRPTDGASKYVKLGNCISAHVVYKSVSNPADRVHNGSGIEPDDHWWTDPAAAGREQARPTVGRGRANRTDRRRAPVQSYLFRRHSDAISRPSYLFDGDGANLRHGVRRPTVNGGQWVRTSSAIATVRQMSFVLIHTVWNRVLNNVLLTIAAKTMELPALIPKV